MVTVSSSGSSSVSLTVSLNISVAGGDGAVNDGVAVSASDSVTAGPDTRVQVKNSGSPSGSYESLPSSVTESPV